MEKYKNQPHITQNYHDNISQNDILSKSQRSKALERFNKHRRIGEDHLTKHQLQTVLVQIGINPDPTQLELMAETDKIDQMYFYNVVNQYKIHREQSDGGLIQTAFQSLKENDQGKINISQLKQTFLEDFGINITDFIGSNKLYLSLQEFKNMFY